jgi:hypothetical protein
MQINYSNNTEKNKALAATLIFHGILLILLWVLKVSNPDPPLTASEGMVVNLGYVDESTGDIQPLSEDQNKQPIITHEQIKSNQTQNEKIITQSIEETEAIKTSEKLTQNVSEDKNNEKPTENVTDNQPQQTPINPAILYKGKKNNATSQGNSDKGIGDQGDPNGDPFATNYGKNTGNGNGSNVYNGSGGIMHTLLNRKAENLTKPEYDCNETGIVIVEIWVNPYGKVIRAKAGARGSTTTSICLYTKAENAAYKTRFNANPDAPEEQRGTIIYNFTLK